jgi:Ras-related protein Rab-11A
MEETSEMIFKLIIIGDSTTGKTNILSRYLNNKFEKISKSTIGVELGNKTFNIKNNIVNCQIWDTAGQERYRSMTKAYYKGALGALIVYDITKKTTFESVENWLTDLKNSADQKISVILIGNKNDLEEEREVTIEEGEMKAKEFGIAFLETSALNGTNIEKAFKTLVEEVDNKCHKEFESVTDVEIMKGKVINLDESEKETKKSKCCDKYYYKSLKKQYL